MKDIVELFLKEVLPYCGVAVSTIIAIIQTIKRGGVQKGETLYDRMMSDIETAEAMYEPIKAKGIDVATMKKQYVLTDLQIFANSNAIKYEADVWEKELERMIEFSEKVNAKPTKEDVSKKVMY